MNALHTPIKEFRIKAGISLTDAANASLIPVGYLSRIEHGYSFITEAMAYRLIKGYLSMGAPNPTRAINATRLDMLKYQKKKRSS